MFGFGTSTDGTGLTVGQVNVVAFYDPQDGAIRYLHAITTMAGAVPPTEEEALSEARQLGLRRIPDIDRLSIAWSNDIEHSRNPYRIDPSTRSFVPVDSLASESSHKGCS